MQMTIRRAAAAWVCAAGAASVSLGDQPLTVAEIAPPSTILLIGTDDWSGAAESFRRTSLHRMLNEPAVREFLAAVSEDLAWPDPDWVMEELDLMGMEFGDVPMPTGHAGAAWFYFHPDDGEGEKLHVVAAADFGDGAEAARELMTSLVEEAERREKLEYDEREYVDTMVTLLRFDAGAGRGGEAEDVVALAWSGSKLLASTHAPTLEKAIDRAAGVRIDAIADGELFASSLAQHPRGVHAYAVMFVERWVSDFLDAVAMFGGAMADDVDFAGIADATGLGDLRSVSMALRFDTDEADAESTLGVLMREKGGLFTLLDSLRGGFSPPGFIGAEAASVTQMSVRFDRVTDLVREVVRALGLEGTNEGRAALEFVRGSIEPVLRALGSELYMFNTIRRPLSADSERTVTAAQVSDAATLVNAIFGVAPMMGMEARDFQGNQMFDEDSFLATSIGVGLGHVFVGQTEEVENALRLAGDAQTRGLADEDRFRRAAATLERGAVLYSFIDMRRQVEWAIWSTSNAEEIYAAQLDQWGLDGEFRDHILRQYREDRPAWHDELPPADVVSRHLGDMVSELHATPDGFRGRTLLLRGDAR